MGRCLVLLGFLGLVLRRISAEAVWEKDVGISHLDKLSGKWGLGETWRKVPGLTVEWCLYPGSLR